MTGTMTLLRTITASLLSAALASAATFTEVPNFGENPTGAKLYTYVPDKLPASPALIVGLHWCNGDAPAYYQGTSFARRAEELGYIVLYPDAPASDGCWDVASAGTLKHLGGGDSLAIHNMVQWALKTYPSIDKSRIFAVGTSSGAMMTNVLLGAYPDIFAAGSAWAGVPFGCFAGPTSWNSECSEGRMDKTPQEWGDLVRAAYPGYTGRRPRMQWFHGSEDEILSYKNFEEGQEQWVNVLGLEAAGVTEEKDTPKAGWTRWAWGGDKLEMVREEGVSHNLEVIPEEALRFFKLTERVTPTTTVAPPAATTTAPGGAEVPRWGQCGGINWNGGTKCAAGTTCVKVNDWYHQCQ